MSRTIPTARSLLSEFDRQSKRLILTPASVRALYGLPAVRDTEMLFQIHENEFQSEFLTVWPIIRNPELFRRVAALLADRLLKLRGVGLFNRIVTCSPTMRYFIEEISFNLRHHRANLSFEYLGLHPMQGLRLGSVREFTAHDHVAIISDVVSSGRLIDEMTSIVSQSGATVVGSLSIFCTEFVSVGRLPSRFSLAPELPLSRDNPKNALFVAKMTPAPQTSSDVQPLVIDRSTVYADVGGFVDTDFKPILDIKDALAVQRRWPLLSVGTHSSNDKWMSLAVDIDLLLRRLGTAIEPNIVPAFKLDHNQNKSQKRYIVTTPSRENRVFVGFLARALKKAGYRCTIVVIPRSENLNEQYSYFAPERIELPSNETVFLCLATVSTSEKLRALAAYLAMSGAKSIAVLTLLNRMNAASGSFLSRVINLQAGERREPLLFADILDSSEFRYSSFFKIHDLATEDLVRGRRLAEQIVQSYAEKSKSVFYSTQAQNELKYFEPENISGAAFKADKKLNLADDMQAVKLCTDAGVDPAVVPESVAYALCVEQFLINKETGLLTLLLLSQSTKNLTYALVRLVMLNAALLNIKGFFKHLSFELLSKIGQQEAEKRTLAQRHDLLSNESSVQSFDHLRDNINAISEDQVRSMSILSFISTLRVAQRERQQAVNLLRDVLSVTNSKTDVACGFISASNPVFLWSVTFFSHAFGITEEIAPLARGFSEVLNDEMHGFSRTGAQHALFDRVLNTYAVTDARAVDLLADTAACVDDFALYFVDSSELSRFSNHRAVLVEIEKLLFNYTRVGHIGAYKNLQRIVQFFRERLAHQQPDEGALYWLDFSAARRRNDAKFIVNSSLMAISDLLRAAPYIVRLIEFSQNYEPWTRYFSSGSGATPFVTDLERLQELLHPLRTEYRILRLDVEEVQQLIQRVCDVVWNHGSNHQARSDLFKLVSSHCFRISELLDLAVASSNHTLSQVTGTDRFWSKSRIESQLPAEESPCFGNRAEILDALENALENARHQLATQDHEDLRRNVIVSEDDMSVMINVYTFGTSFEERARDPRRAPTWQAQARRLQAFDGDFAYEVLTGPEAGALATITIAKTPFKAVRPLTDSEGDLA